nr:hypothetical protein [Candidatus Pantoea persica]MBA2814312.1 acetyl-CoA C-acyltransferase FadA [Candidatus Pantoea persica]
MPTYGHDADGVLKRYDYDEVILKETSLEGLAALRPEFEPANSTVTAGSSSAFSDGAAALLVMSESRARVRSMAVVGCDPSIMGYGPRPSSKLSLKRTGLESRGY